MFFIFLKLYRIIHFLDSCRCIRKGPLIVIEVGGYNTIPRPVPLARRIPSTCCTMPTGFASRSICIACTLFLFSSNTWHKERYIMRFTYLADSSLIINFVVQQTDITCVLNKALDYRKHIALIISMEILIEIDCFYYEKLFTFSQK